MAIGGIRMKDEQKQLLRMLEPLIVCVVFASLYCVGGSGDFWGGQKWLRRYLAPGLFCIWAFIRSFDWRYFVQMPFMFGALCLPYGADSVFEKVVLRGIWGVANGVASSIRNFLVWKVALAITQIVIVTAVSVGLGVWNQTPNAMIEQFLIGFIIILIPAFTVERKKS